jgi:hypothetical protein
MEKNQALLIHSLVSPLALVQISMGGSSFSAASSLNVPISCFQSASQTSCQASIFLQASIKVRRLS